MENSWGPWRWTYILQEKGKKGSEQSVSLKSHIGRGWEQFIKLLASEHLDKCVVIAKIQMGFSKASYARLNFSLPCSLLVASYLEDGKNAVNTVRLGFTMFLTMSSLYFCSQDVKMCQKALTGRAVWQLNGLPWKVVDSPFDTIRQGLGGHQSVGLD